MRQPEEKNEKEVPLSNPNAIIDVIVRFNLPSTSANLDNLNVSSSNNRGADIHVCGIETRLDAFPELHLLD
jgi:hypothetical protein